MKLKMSINEALLLVDRFTYGATFHEDSNDWRAVLLVLAQEVRRLHDVTDIAKRLAMQLDISEGEALQMVKDVFAAM